jgi:hypothetical protein
MDYCIEYTRLYDRIMHYLSDIENSIILCSRALVIESAMESDYMSYIFTLRIVGLRHTLR